MSLNEYISKIESLEFQVQFSVVGGLGILRLAMSQHPIIVGLIDELTGNAAKSKTVYDRMGLLLKKIETETQLSYDESIAAYLYCLSKVDPPMAHKAGERILESGGLWWSVQLAQHVINMTKTEAA